MIILLLLYYFLSDTCIRYNMYDVDKGYVKGVRVAKHRQGPDLEFDLGGFSLQLPVADYASGVSCEPQLGELQLDEKEFQAQGSRPRSGEEAAKSLGKEWKEPRLWAP